MGRTTTPIAVIVEDEAAVRDVAVVLFEESEMRVISCDNAEKAFAYLCQHGDDTAVLFADVRLAGLMDGVDLAHRVRRMWPHVKIILTSGYAGSRSDLPDNVVYLPKPWLARRSCMPTSFVKLSATNDVTQSNQIRMNNARKNNFAGGGISGGHIALQLADGIALHLPHALGGDAILVGQLMQSRFIVRHPTALQDTAAPLVEFLQCHAQTIAGVLFPLLPFDLDSGVRVTGGQVHGRGVGFFLVALRCRIKGHVACRETLLHFTHVADLPAKVTRHRLSFLFR